MKENIFLVGFSGTGKTNVGRTLSALLDYEYIDTDLQIEADTGRSVTAIFAEDGEPAFRALESAILEKICESNYQVVATGGGIVLSKENRTAMTANGYVVCLEARPETIYVRLMLDTANRQDAANRPLLKSDDPYQRISTMKAERARYYAEADWTIHTDFLATEEVASEIAQVLPLLRRRSDKQRGGAGSPATPGSPHAARQGSLPFHRGHEGLSLTAASSWAKEPDPVAGPVAPASAPSDDSALVVQTSQGSYPVLFGENLLANLGDVLLKYLPQAANRKAFIISDDQVGPLFAPTVQGALEKSGFRVFVYQVPAGESSKSLTQVSALYDWLAAGRAERKDLVLALGGGVVGDLTGFVASSWLRGLPFVQLPTTLLAMVDSSVGGKTGVNHPTGKNLIGAFYPPQAVIADVLTLTHLPERARRSGWSEVVKHGVIPGTGTEQAALARFERLERNVFALNTGDMALTASILRESVAVKAGVVQEDEREMGLRITLNYGHTYGHALEAAGGYTQLLHGEAVAIGLQGAARLAELLGYCSPEFVARQKTLLEAFGLPTSARVYNFDREKILASMKLDKKVEAGAVRWILPRGIGSVEVTRAVPAEAVAQVLEELL
ncbi:MAG: 3-dehydroquinate synthase [Chloroflexi bacterium]|nr:3-dehydroquinate synthase [Chloroflexota bacterium]OJW02780.1 MAG: 3-dehydroquinate synthase [Chloroflexi bacterium 54-19]